MGQARRKKLAGYQAPQLPRVFYNGKQLSLKKTKWIIENHPESLRRMD